VRACASGDVDRLGPAAAGFIVGRLLDQDAPIVVAVDDTLFKRWGRKVLRRSGRTTGDIARCAVRWSIEPSNATGKQPVPSTRD
jgi:hypothetical protein